MKQIIYFHNGDNLHSRSLLIHANECVIPRKGEEVILPNTKRPSYKVKSVCYNYAIQSIIIFLK